MTDYINEVANLEYYQYNKQQAGPPCELNKCKRSMPKSFKLLWMLATEVVHVMMYLLT